MRLEYWPRLKTDHLPPRPPLANLTISPFDGLVVVDFIDLVDFYVILSSRFYEFYDHNLSSHFKIHKLINK